jgi:integrase
MTGAGHIYRRGRIWWVKYYLRGRPHFESSHSDSEAKARELLRKRMRSHTTGSEERVSYEDLEQGIVQDYEVKGYRSLGDLMSVRLKHVRSFFKGQRAIDITTPRLRQYVVMRRKGGAANETINRELSVIRRMLSIARQDRTIWHIPHFPMLEPGQPRESYVTPSEFHEILKHLPGHDQGIVRWIWNTGWRITAACNLAWKDVNLAEGYAVLTRENAKNKRPQKIPLVGELSLIIGEALDMQKVDQPLVFHHSGGQPFRRESVWRAFKKACVRAGLGNEKTLHDMRRSAARDLIRTGVVSEDVARRITGHQTRAVFSRYNITADNDVAQALVALQQHRDKRPGEGPSTVTELSPPQDFKGSSSGTAQGRKPI